MPAKAKVFTVERKTKADLYDEVLQTKIENNLLKTENIRKNTRLKYLNKQIESKDRILTGITEETYKVLKTKTQNTYNGADLVAG